MPRRAITPAAFGILLVALLLTGSGEHALAGPKKATRDARARQLPSGGTVEASVRVRDGQPGGPGAETVGEISESDGLVTYYWKHMPGEVISCPISDEGYALIRHDRSTEPPTVTIVEVECLPPDAAPSTPEPPPDPPTITELTDLARDQIVAAEITLSPEIEGVTGLETWFWYDGNEEVSVIASIRGYAVQATMRPSRFYWETGDPDAPLLESTTPGSPENPAVVWTYETKADYVVRMQVVWDGTWSYSGAGAAASGNLATVRATSERAYPVGEIRSVLTD